MVVVLGAGVGVPAGAATAADFCSGQSAPQHVVSGNQAPTPHNDTIGALAGGQRRIEVLANDTDPENDDLFVVSAGTPDRGEVCVDSDGEIEYFAASSATNYADHFSYGVTDGDLYRTATVTVNVKGIKPLRAQLVHRRTARHKAQVRFTNPNDRTMVVFAGSPKKKKPSLTRTISPGKTVGFRTKDKHIVFFALTRDLDGQPIFVDIGSLNTKTGAQTILSGDEAFFRKHPSLRPLKRAWTHQG